MNIVEQWRERLESKYRLIVNGHDTGEARGGEKGPIDRYEGFGFRVVGYGKNRAVQYSSGRFLCFQDAVNRPNFDSHEINLCLG